MSFGTDSPIVGRMVSNDSGEGPFGTIVEIRGMHVIIKTEDDRYVTKPLSDFNADSSWSIHATDKTENDVGEPDEYEDSDEIELEHPNKYGNARERIMHALKSSYPSALNQREISELCGWSYKANGNKRIGTRVKEINEDLPRISIITVGGILHYLWKD